MGALGKWDDGKPLSKKEKEGFRNRISAQISRRNKKSELASLQEENARLVKNFKVFLQTLDDEVNEQAKQKIVKRVSAKIEDNKPSKEGPSAPSNKFSATVNTFMGILN